jgi:hypothetical protein
MSIGPLLREIGSKTGHRRTRKGDNAMSLQVTERQQVEQWYELSGYIEACEVFPRLLPNSESVAEVEDDIESEHEFKEGRYDGCPQEDDAMEGEIDDFTKSAISEFHDEALTAAKNMLTALKAGETLLHKTFQDEEEAVLEEAAKALGIAVPWDPAEAAQIAADEAARQVRLQQERELAELRAKKTAEVLENARQLFKTGNSHAAVRAMFPAFETAIASLVGAMRKEGVQIATR